METWNGFQQKDLPSVRVLEVNLDTKKLLLKLKKDDMPNFWLAMESLKTKIIHKMNCLDLEAFKQVLDSRLEVNSSKEMLTHIQEKYFRVYWRI